MECFTVGYCKEKHAGFVKLIHHLFLGSGVFKIHSSTNYSNNLLTDFCEYAIIKAIQTNHV